MTNQTKKILLGLLPYWEPQIPPMGISSLKTYLQANGYAVKTIDANTMDSFSEIHRDYFSILETFVPTDKRGNFHNIGQDVMRNHMMAHFHRETGPAEEQTYLQLVKTIVSTTFYQEINDHQATSLVAVVEKFFQVLADYVLARLEEVSPDILGLSVYRGNLAASMFVFYLTRTHYPHIQTVMGGAVFAGELAVGSPNLEYFLERTPYIDTLLAGEGELLLLKYLRGELPGNQRLYTLNDIAGQTFDVTTAAVPDFSDFNLDFYPNMAAYASRSCPFQCSFCTETVYWGKYRKKNASQVVQQMVQLHREYRNQLFLMCDSLLNPIVTDLAEELIRGDHSLYWDGYLRADPPVCNTDNTFLWRQGGFYRARLGIESGSPNVLQLMGKKTSLQQIKKAISSLAAVGIKTTTYWVIGHPGETEADFLMTLELIEELKDDIYEAWCSPFNYYPTGQVDSDQWQNRQLLLYPPQAKKLLVVQTWILDCSPSREEVYSRVNRFVDHIHRLDVPNPYSMMEFFKADERWKKLHKNAVPPAVEFENKTSMITENKYVQRIVEATQKLDNSMTFDF